MSTHKRIVYILFALTFIPFSCVFAQLGIKAGVNMATQIRSFSTNDFQAAFQADNLTGYQIGAVYQAEYKDSGFGTEIGALFTQKGGVFQIDETGEQSATQGYDELNYIEIPINLRYALSFGGFGLYAFGGIYGGTMLKGKTVNQTTEGTSEITFGEFVERMDFGYSYGLGFELLEKIQLGVTWSQGIKKSDKINLISPENIINSKNKNFSVGLVYLF